MVPPFEGGPGLIIKSTMNVFLDRKSNRAASNWLFGRLAREISNVIEERLATRCGAAVACPGYTQRIDYAEIRQRAFAFPAHFHAYVPASGCSRRRDNATRPFTIRPPTSGVNCRSAITYVLTSGTAAFARSFSTDINLEAAPLAARRAASLRLVVRCPLLTRLTFVGAGTIKPRV